MKTLLNIILFSLALSFVSVISPSCQKDSSLDENPKDSLPIDTLPNDTTPVDTVPVDSIKPNPKYYFKPAQKPFPQHIPYSNGVILPSGTQVELDQKVVDFYRQWRSRYLKAMNDTQYYVHYTLEYKVGTAVSCSEGHGFGMVITALMAGVDTTSYDDFIKLYNFYDTHRSGIDDNLMAWQQNGNGANTSGDDSASDGDLDIAFSLLLAHKQWGSDGDVDFLKAADAIIESIYKSDISAKYKSIELGDWVNGGNYAKSTRCCDFMLDHLRTFSNYTADNKWYEVIDTTYNIINTVSHDTTGLYPDFVIFNDDKFVACPPNFLESDHDGDYYYNSCRAPWRIAMDYIVNGDTRAHNDLLRLNKWIYESTVGSPSKIRAGYKLNGTPLFTYSDMAFTAPFGVNAMVDVQNQEWLDAMWVHINKQSISSEAYFGNSIKMLSIITMSGNWWAPY